MVAGIGCFLFLSGLETFSKYSTFLLFVLASLIKISGLLDNCLYLILSGFLLRSSMAFGLRDREYQLILS